MSDARNKHWRISTNDNLTIKGLLSPSIREVPISLHTDREQEHILQAIEFYEGSQSENSFPLVAVDIASNTYLRLSYLKPCSKSATLGTSIVGTFSFRTADNILHFIPSVNFATLELNKDSRPAVRLNASFGKLANITLTRTYLKPSLNLSDCKVDVSFEALKDIELAQYLLGKDAFRFCTISSMFTPARYDGNILEYSDSNFISHEFVLDSKTKRGNYILENTPEILSNIGLIKDSFSSGNFATPGSPDSPSIRIKAEKTPYKLGIQAYLARTLNINADSLSVWLEWKDAPKIIYRGTKMEFSYTVTATAPQTNQLNI